MTTTTGYVYVCHEKTGPICIGVFEARHNSVVTHLIEQLVAEDGDLPLEVYETLAPEVDDVIYAGWYGQESEIARVGPATACGHVVGVSWTPQNDEEVV